MLQTISMVPIALVMGVTLRRKVLMTRIGRVFPPPIVKLVKMKSSTESATAIRAAPITIGRITGRVTSKKARSGEAPTLALSLKGFGRALLVWLALAVCAFLIEPLGFLVAGEVMVLLVIVVVERIRSIPLIITLLLLPPAMYFLFDTLLEVQLPGGTLWY